MFFHLYITYSSSKKAQNLENGFMKESGTYFISEFNNFFPVFFFFFFFRENSFTNDIFIFILVYILLFCKKESATRCNNINIQLSRFRSVRKLWLVASSIYDILFVELEKEFCLYTKNSLFN